MMCPNDSPGFEHGEAGHPPHDCQLILVGEVFHGAVAASGSSRVFIDGSCEAAFGKKASDFCLIEKLMSMTLFSGFLLTRFRICGVRYKAERATAVNGVTERRERFP
jgi:hypothetical protein